MPPCASLLCASLPTVLLACGCTSDALVIPQDGGAQSDRSVDAGPDIEEWIRQFGGAEADEVSGVATDAAGNAFVVGQTWGWLDFPNRDAGDYDAFLVKYDAKGSRVWTRQLGTAGYDGGHGVATDGSGGIYLTGETNGAFPGNQNAGWSDAFLVKYDRAGNKLWTRQFGNVGYDAGYGVATDDAGNVYVAGSTDGGLDGNQNAGGSDAFLVKYDADGNKLWTRQFGTVNNDGGAAVATDGAGNVYVTGDTEGEFDGNPNAGSGDAFLVKYDANGNKLWMRQFGRIDFDHFDLVHGVAVDGSGVYVSGSTYGAFDGDPKPDSAGVPQYDAFLVKFDDAGNNLWTRQFKTRIDDDGCGVAIDGTGHVYVAGWTDGRLDGDDHVGLDDAFLVKYDARGNKLFTRQFGTVRTDHAQGVATDSAGHVFVTGRTSGAFPGYQNLGSDDVFLARFPAAP